LILTLIRYRATSFSWLPLVLLEEFQSNVELGIALPYRLRAMREHGVVLWVDLWPPAAKLMVFCCSILASHGQ
jgi:hypothetical protein